MAAEFDERMMERLKAFQLHHGMSGDGVAGPATWSKLVGGTTPSGQDESGGATEELCGCAIDEAHIVDGALQFDPGEPDGLSGAVEEGDGEDAAGVRQVSGGRPAHPIPSGCRNSAKACFSVSQRRVWLLRPGRVLVASFPALGGRPGHETPVGPHSVMRKIEHGHISSIYHAPMELYVQFADKVGFHVGSLSVQSHGCVHLTHDGARRTFDHLNRGDAVDVVD